MNRDEMGQSLNLSVEMIAVGRHNRPGNSIRPTSITLHNTDNTRGGADADAHSRFVRLNGYQKPAVKRGAVSWHYTVDDKRAIKHLPIHEEAWHAGRRANKSSIAIETCMNRGIDQDAADDRLARLVAVLRHDLGFGREDIKSHRDWTGKNCPRLLLRKWNALMDRIDHYVNEMNEAERIGSQAATSIDHMAAAAEPYEIDHGALASAVNDMDGLDGEGTSYLAHVEAHSETTDIMPRLPEDESEDGADTDEGDEPDESFVPAHFNILSYNSADEVVDVVNAVSFTTLQSYKSDFADSIADLNLRHFQPHEFLTLGGSNGNPASRCYNKNALPPRSLWRNVRKLALALDAIRDRLGSPIQLNSVYRNDAYNRCLSGAVSNSYHKRFMAADFKAFTGSPRAWARVARQVRSSGVYVGGIGTYPTFVHIDMGPQRSW